MKFKKTLLMLSLCLTPLVMTGCRALTPTQVDFDIKTKEVYQKAVEAGFEGTYEEWLATIKGEPGKDGKEIQEIKFISQSEGNANYEVIYSDGTKDTITIPLIQGPAGQDGKPGADGQDGKPGADGQDGATGPVGPEGPAGQDGQDGATGPQGPQGDKGDQGEVGPQGPQGEKGEPGANGQDGATGPQGEKGDKGDQGEVGPQGPAGQDGQDGKPGANGQDGKPGTDGADGLSAYEIYLKYHPEYTGTEQDWIEDLVAGRLGQKYTVKFFVDDKVIHEEQVKRGEFVTSVPTPPAKIGYKFLNWTVNGEPYFEKQSILENTNVVANYLKIEQAPVTRLNGMYTNDINITGFRSGYKYSKKINRQCTFDLDLTPNNLYLHINGPLTFDQTNQLEQVVPFESLLYKDSEGYKFVDSNVDVPVAVKDENAALDYINKMFLRYTNDNNAFLDISAFTFDLDKRNDYLYNHFCLKDSEYNSSDMSTIYKESYKDNILTYESPYTFGYYQGKTVKFEPVDPTTKTSTIDLTLNDTCNLQRVTHTINECTYNSSDPKNTIKMSGKSDLSFVFDNQVSKRNSVAYLNENKQFKMDRVGTGEVTAYVSPFNNLTEKTPLSSGQLIPVGSWITIVPQTKFGSKLLRVNYAEQRPVEPNTYVYDYLSVDKSFSIEFTKIKLSNLKLDTDFSTIFNNFYFKSFELINAKPQGAVTLENYRLNFPTGPNYKIALLVHAGDPLNGVAPNGLNVKFTLPDNSVLTPMALPYKGEHANGYMYMCNTALEGTYHVSVSVK